MLNLRFSRPIGTDNSEEFVFVNGAHIISIDTRAISLETNAHLFDLEEADPDDLKYIATVQLAHELVVSFPAAGENARMIKTNALHVVGHGAAILSAAVWGSEPIANLDILDLFTAAHLQKRWSTVVERIKTYRALREA